MRLRSDFREAVTIMNRLHRESGEGRPEPIPFHQYQRWHSSSSSSSSWWQWNQNWWSSFFKLLQQDRLQLMAICCNRRGRGKQYTSHVTFFSCLRACVIICHTTLAQVFVRVISSMCHAPECFISLRPSLRTFPLSLPSSTSSSWTLTSTFSSSMWMFPEQDPLCTSPNEESGPLANNAPLIVYTYGSRCLQCACFISPSHLIPSVNSTPHTSHFLVIARICNVVSHDIGSCLCARHLIHDSCALRGCLISLRLSTLRSSQSLPSSTSPS